MEDSSEKNEDMKETSEQLDEKTYTEVISEIMDKNSSEFISNDPIVVPDEVPEVPQVSTAELETIDEVTCLAASMDL